MGWACTVQILYSVSYRQMQDLDDADGVEHDLLERRRERMAAGGRSLMALLLRMRPPSYFCFVLFCLLFLLVVVSSLLFFGIRRRRRQRLIICAGGTAVCSRCDANCDIVVLYPRYIRFFLFFFLSFERVIRTAGV